MQIVTVTLNPAYDYHYTLEHFCIGKQNYACAARCDAGGKGINISRALVANGIENTAFAVLGLENCREYEALLKSDGVSYRAVYTKGRIRENIMIHAGDAPETRVSMDEARLPLELLQQLGALLPREDTLLAFSGRLPGGVSKAEIVQFLRQLAPAKVVVDSNSMTMEDVKSVHPWLVKPNIQEASAWLGEEVHSLREAIPAAKRLACGHTAQEVMISCGEEGLAWSDGRRCLTVHVPRVKVLSTVGAGDSTVAGYLAAQKEKRTTEEALCLAAAYGTAACMREGTLPPEKQTVQEILAQTECREA